MKMKDLLILLAILAALIVVIIAYNKISNRAPAKSERLMFPRLDTAKVAAIEVKENANRVKIQKTAGQWRLPDDENFLVDSAMIAGVVSGIAELEKRDLVSTNKQRRGNYGVDSASDNFRVICRDEKGKILADFWIGSRGGASYDANEHIRIEGGDEVYASKQSVKHKFISSARQWRNRTFWRLSPDRISGFDIERPDLKYSLSKGKEGKWMVLAAESTMTADTAKIREYVNTVCELRVSDWPAKGDTVVASAFQKPELNVTVVQGDGSRITLTIGREKEHQLYCRASTDTTVFLLSSYNLNTLKKHFVDFKYIPPPPPPDTTKKAGPMPPPMPPPPPRPPAKK